ELTIGIDDTQTPPTFSVIVPNSSSRFVLPPTNDDSSLPPENSGESLLPVGSGATILNNNDDTFSSTEPDVMDHLDSSSIAIGFNNSSRPISLPSTRRSTSSMHRIPCNYDNCGRTFRSQGEWQEHQYQHYGESRKSKHSCVFFWSVKVLGPFTQAEVTSDVIIDIIILTNLILYLGPFTQAE
ncbi:20085_t:CDS:2, partial [Dentiscutata erythropus]